MSEEFVEYEVENPVELESWKVDSMIEEVKANNEDLKRYKEILDNRIKELTQQFEQKKESIEKRNHFILTTLREFSLSQESTKSTKTQYKYSSLAGDVIIKKPIPKVAKPTKDVYEEIEKVYPEFVEKVEDKKVNWKELKKRFVIQSGRIFDQETGEDVSGLFGVEVNEEEVVVK